ncbi:hypothetical protein KQX54_003881 [Cotesia glomerata]|uniref:Uncharacterized protein n=1 Tax=Cotesia glomerata TaxID=32391 RepID=A0AAV7IKV4_COTGL|nr:hypothetical protein KQX54_003881 [Cotesia glomerata]
MTNPQNTYANMASNLHEKLPEHLSKRPPSTPYQGNFNLQNWLEGFKSEIMNMVHNHLNQLAKQVAANTAHINEIFQCWE